MENIKHKFMILLLAVYWIGIFTLTHIPIPKAVYQAGVSDKILHFLAYLICTFLFWNAVSSCKKINWKKPTVWWITIVLIIYGTIDEWLQQYVGRSTDLTDFFANMKGVATGLVLLSIFDFGCCLTIVTSISILALTVLSKNNPAEIMPKTFSVFHLFAYGFFTQLWIWNISEYIKKIKPPHFQWLVIATAAPLIFLSTVIITAKLTNRYFDTRNIMIALVAISAIILANLFAALLNKRAAEIKS